MRIAFYAPIKPPDHPIPSGDRLIAGNLIKALRQAGFEVELASRFIAYSKRSDEEILASRKIAALDEAARLISHYQAMKENERPQLWVTYHPYCKAPDWIGPSVALALGIPYITIEACKTGQGDQWLPWRAEAQAGIELADHHLWFKPMDRDYLVELLGGDETLHKLPPFIDLADQQQGKPAQLPDHWDNNTPVLITVGMMRKGKKDRNFYLMAEILQDMQDVKWNMVIVGGGPEQEAVQQAFSRIAPERLHWCGQVTSPDVARWMRACDIFIWPGWKEPIGMVYLEAASQGLPVVAFDNMGVPLVVRHGETGLLSELDDQDAFRKNLKTLLNDESLRRKMGKTANLFVQQERSMQAVTVRLSKLLTDFYKESIS